MDLEKFRAMINKPDRSKDDLLQILKNCLNRPEFANEVREVLAQRFPQHKRISRARGSRGSPTQSSFKGQLCQFDSAKEAYVWLVERMIAVRPEVFIEINSDTSYIALGAKKLKVDKKRMRNYFARTPEKLFWHTPTLIDNTSNYGRLTNGWYANLNISHVQKFQILCRLSRVLNLSHGTDWDFEILDGTDRLMAAKERERLMAEFDLEM